MANPYKAGDSLFTAPQAARAALAELAYRREHRDQGIYLGIPDLDSALTPILSDNLVSIVANPGNGKTRFMLRWAQEQAKKIAAAGEKGKAVIFVTYEQSVEDLKIILAAADCGVSIEAMIRGTISEADWNKVTTSLTQSIGVPLSIIGHSKDRRNRRPRLSMDNVEAEIAYHIDQLGIQPHMIFIDYLQRIPAPRAGADRRMEVSENMDRCKDAALKYGAPWVVGVQAKREVLARSLPIPMLPDGQETSNIEQASDVVLSLTRPCKHRAQNEAFDKVPVKGYKQMLVSLLKQKLGRDNVTAWVDFDMATNKMTPVEVRHVNLEDV
jgi:replicative DNA helicase